MGGFLMLERAFIIIEATGRKKSGLATRIIGWTSSMPSIDDWIAKEELNWESAEFIGNAGLLRNSGNTDVSTLLIYNKNSIQ